MSEPVTTTTASFIMPSPTQLIIGGVALGVGLTAGYGLACWTASLVDSGLEKSGIKDRVERLMSSGKKKKHEEDEEVEIEDELEDEEVEDEDEEDEDEEVEIEDELEDEEAEDEDEEVEAVKQSAKKAREKAAA